MIWRATPVTLGQVLSSLYSVFTLWHRFSALHDLITTLRTKEIHVSQTHKHTTVCSLYGKNIRTFSNRLSYLVTKQLFLSQGVKSARSFLCHRVQGQQAAFFVSGSKVSKQLSLSQGARSASSFLCHRVQGQQAAFFVTGSKVSKQLSLLQGARSASSFLCHRVKGQQAAFLVTGCMLAQWRKNPADVL